MARKPLNGRHVVVDIETLGLPSRSADDPPPAVLDVGVVHFFACDGELSPHQQVQIDGSLEGILDMWFRRSGRHGPLKWHNDATGLRVYDVRTLALFDPEPPPALQTHRAVADATEEALLVRRFLRGGF